MLLRNRCHDAALRLTVDMRLASTFCSLFFVFCSLFSVLRALCSVDIAYNSEAVPFASLCV